MRSIAKDALRWVGLVTVTVILWFINQDYPSFWLGNLVLTFAGISIIYLVIRVLLENLSFSQIQDPKTRYSFRKGTSVLFYFLIFITIFAIWVRNTQALLVSYGIVAAGIAIALQDVIRNFAGSVLIILTGLYTVGDRIEINQVFGDVIDIGIFNTTLMETGGWVGGDLPTGRITLIPNGYAISNTVYNYTKDYNFIWDEISVPITYESDWKEAISVFAEILDTETAPTVAYAKGEIEKTGEKYYFPRKVIEPRIFIALTDNWVAFSLRYVTRVRERRMIRDHLSRRILEAVEQSDSLEIASETMTITGSHRVRLEQTEKAD